MCTKKDLDNFDIKVTDFGFAIKYEEDEMLSLTLGSPMYMAPELCTQDRRK